MPSFRLSRAALVDRILADPAPVVLIDAAAGTGKSWLLADIAERARPAGSGIWRSRETMPADIWLWDLPSVPQSGPLPERADRVILAKRPNTAVPGLAQSEVYGRVSRYGNDDMLFAEDEIPSYLPSDLWQRTGGWACLLPSGLCGDVNEAALRDFLRDNLLRPLPSTQLVALNLVLDDARSDRSVLPLTGLPFLTAVQRDLPAPLAACRVPLGAAIRMLLAERANDPVQARAIATAHAGFGQVPEAIAIFQSISAWQAALDVLRQAGGPFFIHRFGPDAFDRMLSRFPSDIAAREEVLILCRALQAVKRGEVPLTRHILTAHYGPVADDVVTVIGAVQRFTLDFRFFRLLLQTWEDFDLDTRLLDAAYRLLAELPADDDLRRGSFYNAVLEFYIRARRFSEADHTAIRAASHYARADVPILSFYIDLHRAIISLFLGETAAAQKRAEAAAAHIGRAGHESPGDVRLLALLQACIAYERGEGEPLTRFLSRDLDAFAQGEIWPTLLELVLVYGSQALGEHFSTMAALAFLNRWRATQERSSQFGMLIDIREVVVMQNGNRWQNAMVKAHSLDTRITLPWVEEAGDRLGMLSNRDEVALALVWLRHMAQLTPGRPGLVRQLDVMLDNPHLNGRQRIGVEIWRAHVLRRQRRVPEAQTALECTLSMAAQMGAVATLGEERVFLADLTGNKRLSAAIDRADHLRRLLRQLGGTGPGWARRGRGHGLTRQETHILHAIAEGATNKAIANLMGLSEATVKFHLSNLYRKLGCTSRKETVAAARKLQLVA